MFKLMLGEAARRPMVADMINTIGPGRIFPLLRRYIERQTDAGVFRRMDSGAAVRCFFGSLMAFVLTREIFPQPDSATLSAETMVQTAIDIFLQGMLAPPAATDTPI
ncbi:MAG TPA: TetR/AcrR family transcriptional regulator C-terminal domain-containing protein [Roseiflexaceae bacterium]|nr:TetR/AcrR family transcriptional regulator C-terminal domain-containing protein [Roseiflexaceae bacterium]